MGSDLQSPCSRRDGLDGFPGENKEEVLAEPPPPRALLDLHLCLDTETFKATQDDP